MSSPSFRRWATGRAAVEEKRRWDEWVESSPYNHRLAILVQQKVAGLDGLLSVDGVDGTQGLDVAGLDIDGEGMDAATGSSRPSGLESSPALDETSGFLDEEWEQVVARIRAKAAGNIDFEGLNLESLNLEGLNLEGPEGRSDEPGQQSPEERQRKSVPAMLLMAAALILVSGFTALMVHDQLSRPPIEDQTAGQAAIETITTDYSEKRTLYLSDGTRIILAAGSSLSWSEDWLAQPIRQVTLNRGEAYFSVERRSDRPYGAFEVITKDGKTSVLGTKFTVSTYGEGTQVVLQEGEVEIMASVGIEELSRVTLTPGERARWRDKADSMSLSRVNPDVYTSWTTDELYFEDTPLTELVQRIERTYGFSVEVEDPALLERELTGSVDFRSLDGLISAVSSVLEIDIKRVDDQILISQT